MKDIKTRFLIIITTLLLVSSIILTGCGILSTETVTQTQTTTVQGTSIMQAQAPNQTATITNDSAIEPIVIRQDFTDRYTVPFDKVLVIEFVTVRFEYPPDFYLKLEIIATTNSNAEAYALTLIESTGTGNDSLYQFSGGVKIYADPDSEVYLYLMGWRPPYARGTISGYLLDVSDPRLQMEANPTIELQP